MKKTLFTLTLVLGSLVSPLSCNADAQVMVNGFPVKGEELILLERLMRTSITSGHYWLDANGNWGYAGNPAIQGNFLSSSKPTLKPTSGLLPESIHMRFMSAPLTSEPTDTRKSQKLVLYKRR